MEKDFFDAKCSRLDARGLVLERFSFFVLIFFLSRETIFHQGQLFFV